ncbi:MAG: hypothetical protein FWH44_00615 [Methanomassiliicoccaceae archaeon]|nr:hypothetical protein [Methanomassiliicoccaceae archaeon]
MRSRQRRAGKMTLVKGTLTGEEAIGLLNMKKDIVGTTVIKVHNNFTMDLESEDQAEKFIVNFNKGNIALRYTDQLRCRVNIPLLRLDVGAGKHVNPRVLSPCSPRDPFYHIHADCVGRVFLPGEPHIHFYREGYNDWWAYPPEGFTDMSDAAKTTVEFLGKCNVSNLPSIQRALFP